MMFRFSDSGLPSFRRPHRARFGLACVSDIERRTKNRKTAQRRRKNEWIEWIRSASRASRSAGSFGTWMNRLNSRFIQTFIQTTLGIMWSNHDGASVVRYRAMDRSQYRNRARSNSESKSHEDLLYFHRTGLRCRPIMCWGTNWVGQWWNRRHIQRKS